MKMEIIEIILDLVLIVLNTAVITHIVKIKLNRRREQKENA